MRRLGDLGRNSGDSIQISAAILYAVPRSNAVFGAQFHGAESERLQRGDNLLAVLKRRLDQQVHILGVAGTGMEGNRVGADDAVADSMLIEQS